MQIRSLASVPFTTLLDTILQAFDGYFVQLPADPVYWQDRFHCANVDFARSYGAFEGERLVAFIIQGFGMVDGRMNAYNSGTGVLPAFRGRQLVDALYAAAIPSLRTQDIDHCSLEVIDKNAAAIRVYERIGFEVAHRWKCFKGTVTPPALPARSLFPNDLRTAPLGDDRWASWDHRVEALRRTSGMQRLFSFTSDPAQGHVLLNPTTGRIARLGVADETNKAQWLELLTAVARITPTILLVNVHPDRTALIDALEASGISNHIDQFEMRMEL